MKALFLILCLFALASCNGKGGKFSDLEEDADENNLEVAIEIEDFIPDVDPVVLTSNSSTTFALSVNGGAGNVNYKFQLDGTTTLQDSTSPFYALLGSSVVPGVHTLRVTATNSVSSATKDFNLRRNNIPAILSSSPALAGNTVNCGAGTLTFNALTADADSDVYTQTWILDGVAVTPTTEGTVVTNGIGSAQLAYTPTCAMSGFHTLTLRLYDGYETLDQTWSIGVANPAVETIISYDPTSNNITYLSTDVSKTFNATGSGVGSLTFTWKLDGVTVQTQSGVVFNAFNLLATSMTVGTHTLRLELTDSSLTNDPPGGAVREWTIYKNQKPRIISPAPSTPIAINLNTALPLTASIEDALDTFTVSLVKGAVTCNPDLSGVSAACSLTGMVLPTTTNSFSASFTSGSAFLGENTFQLRVTDSYGELTTQDFTITTNYFSDTCNQLEAGEICTLVGLPGLGSGTNVNTNGNRVRVDPSRIIQDERGNFFFADHTTHTVWYYNTTSSPVTLLSVTVPAFSIYVVAGTGVAGAGVNGVDARKMAMSFGTWGGGLAWDSTRQELFIADYTNSRVLRVDSTGRARTVCGLPSALTNQGALAKDSRCTNPSDLAYDNTNKRLYVSQLNDHVIKVIDTSNADFNLWPSYIVAGAYASAANTANTSNLTGFYSTIAGTGRLNQPLGLYLDQEDQILYFTTHQACRVGAIALPGFTPRVVGATNINALNVYYIAGNTCASPTVNTNTTLGNNLFNRPTDLHVHRTGATINGIYVASHDAHRVVYINNQATTTIGGQSVTGGLANNVFGNGTQNAPTNPPTGRNSNLNRPFGILLVGNTLYVGAREGNIIRTLNVSTGTVANFLGGTGRAGYSGNSAIDASLVTWNNPLSLLYKEEGGSGVDPIPGNMMFVADTSNFMIRSVNLVTGRVEDFIGTGAANGENLANTVTTATRMRGPRAMALHDGFFLYNDSNENCFIRGYNPFPTDQTLFSSAINLNKTSNVAGNYNLCTNYPDDDPAPGSASFTERATSDLTARLNGLWGLGVDSAGGKMYAASSAGHCIMRITEAGVMTPFIGSCGIVAGSPVANGSIDFATPRYGWDTLLRAPAEIVMDNTTGLEGNFFFIDFSDQATANIKYVNLTGSTTSFFNSTVNVLSNSVETILALVGSPGFIRGLAIYEEWICYTSGNGTSGNNTINCRNRVSGTTQTFGVPGIGGIQLEQEHEGASVTSGSSTVTFSSPAGLSFDKDGNLYITEQVPQVIRKIKRWFP
jgi:hypothetical protein